MTIYTAHWAAKLPPGHTRVSISRGSPRWQKPESFKHYKFWKPGPWYKTASPQEYLDLFNAILAKLNPGAVYDDLEALGPNPTVLCWEKPKDIQEGNCYCHRHICAQWLEDTLGIKVEEVGHPNLPRFPPRARARARRRLRRQTSTKCMMPPVITSIAPELRSRGLDRRQCCWHASYQFCGLSAEITVYAENEAEARTKAVNQLRQRGLKVA